MSYDALNNPPTDPVDETDTTLASIDLSTVNLSLANRHFRFRRVDVGPGGVVPWHSHANRPAMMFIAVGEIVEHNSNAAGPQVRRAGDVVSEAGDVWHWWKNETNKPVVIYAADLADPNDVTEGEC